MIAFLSNLLDGATLVFAVSSMLSVGFGYTVREIIEPLRNLRGTILALIANFVLVPLWAFAVIRLLPLDESLEIGLILIACAAGAPFLIALTRAAQGDVAFATSLLVLLLPITVVYMPLVVPRVTPGANVSPLGISTPLVLTLLLPLGIGLFVKAQWPGWAGRLRPLMGTTSSAALVVLVVTIFLINLRSIVGILGEGAIFAALLLIGGALVIGYLLGSLAPGETRVVALATAQRNVAAATVVATQTFDDDRVLVMVVISSLVGMATLFPIAWAMAKRTAPKGEAEFGSGARPKHT